MRDWFVSEKKRGVNKMKRKSGRCEEVQIEGQLVESTKDVSSEAKKKEASEPFYICHL